ncbi:MAG: VOC family protein [Acidimicrobiales bacterium]
MSRRSTTARPPTTRSWSTVCRPLAAWPSRRRCPRREYPPVWSTYIAVEDVVATIDDVEAAGGSVFQPPFDIPGGAKIAVIADPAGAVICLRRRRGHGLPG